MPAGNATTTPPACLLTAAAHDAGGRPVAPGVQAQLVQVQAHAGEHLEQGELLLGGLVHKSRAGGVALGPVAVIHQVEGATFGWSLGVFVGLLQIFVPALERT